MGFITNFFMNMSVKTYKKELSSFIENIRYMDADEIALLHSGVQDVAYSFVIDHGINLYKPHLVLEDHPVFFTDLGHIARKMQKQESFFSAASIMVWIFTLRGAHFLELRGLTRDLWRQLARGMDNPEVETSYPEGFTPDPKKI